MAIVVRKNAVKAARQKDERHFLWLYLATSFKEIVSSNTKEHIKWVISGATLFLMFWLHLDVLFFKILSKIICPALLLRSYLVGAMLM